MSDQTISDRKKEPNKDRIDIGDYHNFICTLPSNNFHRFDDLNLFLEVYSNHYPTEQEKEETYRLEDWISSY